MRGKKMSIGFNSDYEEFREFLVNTGKKRGKNR